MSLYGATRNVDMGKQEAELSVNIKKATSIDEVAPKRKHVRACIVYTWDHKSSQSFWAGMKVYDTKGTTPKTHLAYLFPGNPSSPTRSRLSRR